MIFAYGALSIILKLNWRAFEFSYSLKQIPMKFAMIFLMKFGTKFLKTYSMKFEMKFSVKCLINLQRNVY